MADKATHASQTLYSLYRIIKKEGFKSYLMSESCTIRQRAITFRIDLLCLHLDNSELKLALSATREHANTYEL